jgi:predicted permease
MTRTRLDPVGAVVTVVEAVGLNGTAAVGGDAPLMATIIAAQTAAAVVTLPAWILTAARSSDLARPNRNVR